MVQKIKTDLCSLVRGLGYNIVDNGAYIDGFPQLMARLGAYSRNDLMDTRIDNVSIVIDIFSKYKGEKEILGIAENITNHIQEMKNNNDKIIYISQKDLKILDDNSTGPMKKHGVLVYRFLLSSSLGQEDDNNDTSGT